MDTDDLIGKLAADLKPVAPLQSPLTRAWRFTGFALLFVAASIFLSGGMRPDARELITQPQFIAEAVMMLVSGILSAFAAFHLAVPDTRIRKPVLTGLVIGTSVWVLLSLVCCTEHFTGHGVADEHDFGLHCFRDLLAVSVIPVIAAFVMLGRGAPVWKGAAGYAMALSTASFSAIAARLMCPNDAPIHLLLWHFLPVLGFAFLGIVIGRFLSTAKPFKGENK